MEFTFCPQCGKKINKRLEKKKIECRWCGFCLYINPAPTNMVFFRTTTGKILLGKRKFSPFRGYWDVIGGFIDPGETIEESVQREVKEETGILLKKFSYLSSCTERYKYRGMNYHVVCAGFIATVPEKKFQPGDDISELKFFRIKDIPWKKIAFSGAKKTLRRYVKSLL